LFHTTLLPERPSHMAVLLWRHFQRRTGKAPGFAGGRLRVRYYLPAANS
jgi:hypothetical protein